jgi:hypothetical protein
LWDSTASTKEDIVGILVESPKITKEKISAMLKPVGSASKTKVTEKERKIEEEHIKEKIVTEREISRKILTVKEITLETVMDEINEFKKVAPKIRTQDRKAEKLYTRELTGYLRRISPDIKLEQSLGKGTNVGNPRLGSNSTPNIFGTGRTRAPGCKRTKKEIKAFIKKQLKVSVADMALSWISLLCSGKLVPCN